MEIRELDTRLIRSESFHRQKRDRMRNRKILLIPVARLNLLELSSRHSGDWIHDFVYGSVKRNNIDCWPYLSLQFFSPLNFTVPEYIRIYVTSSPSESRTATPVFSKIGRCISNAHLKSWGSMSFKSKHHTIFTMNLICLWRYVSRKCFLLLALLRY